VAAVVFVLVWFQPQKYFLNTTVDEAAPRGIVANPVDPSAGTTPTAAGQATVLASGEFRSLEHGTSGRAMVLELANGSRVLRFEALDTSNGPDLHVYLSEVAAGDDARGYGEGFVDLGKLKGNKGSQNYAIPTAVDLSRYRSAVIWCKRFAVGFGVAPLDRLG
jgi:electron transfer DM13